MTSLRSRNDGSGNRIVETVAKNVDGELDFTYNSVTSPSGNSITNSYDDDGDKVCDRVQTIPTSTAGDGSKSNTLANKIGGPSIGVHRLTSALRDEKVHARQMRGQMIVRTQETYRKRAARRRISAFVSRNFVDSTQTEVRAGLDGLRKLNALSCLDGALLARVFLALKYEMFGAGCGHVFGL